MLGSTTCATFSMVSFIGSPALGVICRANAHQTDWTDEYCGIILKNIKDAMGPNSMLFIDEMVIPTKGAHKIAMQLDIAMLANCISEERSEARWSELLKTVGFKVDHLFTYNDELSDSIMVCTPV